MPLDKISYFFRFHDFVEIAIGRIPKSRPKYDFRASPYFFYRLSFYVRALSRRNRTYPRNWTRVNYPFWTRSMLVLVRRVAFDEYDFENVTKYVTIFMQIRVRPLTNI